MGPNTPTIRTPIPASRHQPHRAYGVERVAGSPGRPPHGGTTPRDHVHARTRRDVTGPAVTAVTDTAALNTLADVAMYYYMNDLRTSHRGAKISTTLANTDKDIAPHQPW